MAPPCSDPARAAFAAFSGAAARHFRGRAAWEVWNEPNVPRYWMGAPDALCYVALARDAAAAIRREDPSREPETAAQAEYLVRALAVNRSGGIPLTIWYCWQEPVLPWNSFGLLDVHGRAKAAYQALQSLRER